MKVSIELFAIDGVKVRVSLPGRYEVCGQCRGSGKIVDPAIDGNGLSASDFNEDPDFAEAYWSGRYDIVCPNCRGKNVEPVVDEDALSPEQKKLMEVHYDHCRWESQQASIEAAERRFGC